VNEFVFIGRGWGHGVGMCQVGCQEMARRGFAADQILRYYYPGAEFTRVY
jgi:stage II sporulation protein D